MLKRLLILAALLAGLALLLGLAPGAAAAASKVVISADSEARTGMEETNVTFTISLENTDTEYDSQTVRMFANWRSGSPWPWEFTKTDGSDLDEVRDNDGTLVPNGIEVARGATVDFRFVVTVPAASAGQSQDITIVGVDFFGSFQGNSTLKSDNKDLIVTLTSVKEYDVELTVDDNSQAGDRLVYSGEETIWGYTVGNTGWETDTFTVNATGVPYGWTLNSGLAADTPLPGLSVPEVNHTITAEMVITPAADARPGSYDLTLEVFNGSGESSDSVTFTVTLPAPDLQVSDISFSPPIAWIDDDDNTQTVTIHATIRNAGGNVDANGVAVATVDVWFTVDGTTVGDIQYLASLKHGEGATAQVTFEPTGDGDLAVQVLVDAWNNQDGSNANDVNIQEQNENNNYRNAMYKVIRVNSRPGAEGSLIRSVTPTSQTVGEMIVLDGYEVPGNVAWESDRDGVLGELPLLEVDTLSLGTHNLTYSTDADETDLKSYYEISLDVDEAGTGTLIMALSARNASDGKWTISVIVINPQVSVNSLDFYLFDTQTNTVESGKVSDIYGYYEGQGKGITFMDNDFNGKLSPGDQFNIYPDEIAGSGGSVDDYRFRLGTSTMPANGTVTVEIVPKGTFFNLTASAEVEVEVGQVVPLTVVAQHAQGGSIVKYQWDFDGDGNFDWSSGSDAATSYIYDNRGTYAARLRVTDGEGHMESVTVTVKVVEVISDPEFPEEPDPSIPAPALQAVLAVLTVTALASRRQRRR